MGSPAKELQVMQKFIADYTNLWPVLKPSKAGEYYAFCNVCNTDFSISHGSWHVSTKKHVKVAKLKKENRSVWAFFKQSGSFDLAATCGKYVAFLKMPQDS